MAMQSLMQDERLRTLPWRDLVALRPREVAWELTLTLPWLLALLLSAHAGWTFAALGAAFVLFLTGLRNAHDAQHGNLGIAPWAHDVFMAFLSLVMLGSVHAVQVNHLRHHRYCLGEDDFEARSARMRGWQAILYGPVFFVMLHVMGWRHGNRRQRRWIAVEMMLIVAYVAFVAIARPAAALELHAAAMILGQCFTAFFAVWTVHHDLDPEHAIARTERGWRNTLFYGMFYHVEHHLYPRVPTPHLPHLAARLDAVRPDLREVKVLPGLRGWSRVGGETVERDGGRRGDVQGVHAPLHGDRHELVGDGPAVPAEAGPLRAEDQRAGPAGGEPAQDILEVIAMGIEGDQHVVRLAQGGEARLPWGPVAERQPQRGAHGAADRLAVQRTRTRGRKHDRAGAQRRARAEDRPDVVGIADRVERHDERRLVAPTQ